MVVEPQYGQFQLLEIMFTPAQASNMAPAMEPAPVLWM